MSDRKLTGVYFLTGLILFPFYRFYIDSDDFLVYLTLAEKYANGNLPEAINSYWGPLFSWIASPLIWMGLSPLISFKLIQLVTGGIAFLLTCRMFRDQDRISVVLKCALIPLFLSYAYLSGTPDLLMVVWYLVFIRLMKKNNYLSDPSTSVLMGALGSLMYVTKGFGFPFFIIAFTLYNLFLLIKERKSLTTLLFRYAAGMTVFLLLSSLWIAPISRAEGAFTISTSGKYNLSLISPAESPDLLEHMSQRTLKGTLLPPPNESALSAWEQPGKLMETFWNPFASSKDFKDYLYGISINIRSIQHFHFGLDAGSLLVLLIFIFYFREKASFSRFFRENALLIFPAVLCTALYVLILAVHRYVWINDIVIAVLLAVVLNELKLSKVASGAITALASLLLLFHPVKGFTDHFRGDQALARSGTSLRNDHVLKGAVASMDITVSEKNYTRSSTIAYYTKNKYYGMLTYDNFLNSGAEQLKKYNIRHVLVWNDRDLFNLEKYGMKKTFIPEINLSIYTLSSDPEIN